MIQLARRSYSLIILYAVALHYLWALTLAVNIEADGATALSPFVHLLGLPVWVLPALFCLVATLSLSALVSPTISKLNILMMLPQQFTLTVSAYGAVHAVWVGHFGDGVERPTMFILADQAPAIIAATCHTLAIMGMGQRWKPL